LLLLGWVLLGVEVPMGVKVGTADTVLLDEHFGTKCNFCKGKLRPPLQSCMKCWVLLGEGHPLPYSAFHTRSPTRAVTGPVEIDAFSTWN
jgi:hypothetical protein